MSGCLRAQAAADRLATVDEELAQLRRLLRLLADAVGVDLDELLARDDLACLGDECLMTWRQREACGLPCTEDSATAS